MARSSQLPAWRRLLDGLRETHLELLRLAPYQDYGLTQNPSASSDEIEELERRLGLSLPPAYREFLRFSNGWARLFDGAALFGTADFGNPEVERRSRALLEGAMPKGLKDDRRLLTFGGDAQGTTSFAFDYSRGGREPSVIAWVSELGLVAGSFTEFLGFLLELSQRELSVQRERGLPATPSRERSHVSAA